MPVDYPDQELLHSDDLTKLTNWHHEGTGSIEALRGGGIRLACLGSRQGREGCMAFFRPNLPDHVAYEYDLVVKTHGGLVINYLAIRGLNGEDMIEDIDKLPARTGIMANYFSATWGLQSYHVSISRFGDDGVHTETSNWRRNPGCKLAGHGIDPCTEIGRRYHIRVVKDWGHCQLFADGRFAHGFVDHDESSPIPDHGKFGFRIIGSEVIAEVFNFKVHRVEHDPRVYKSQE